MISGWVGEFSEQVVIDRFEIYGMLPGMAAVRFMANAEPDEVELVAGLAANVERHLGRMYPLGFFDLVEGAGEAQKQSTEDTWGAIQSGSEDKVREACLAASRDRGALIVEHLGAAGTF